MVSITISISRRSVSRQREESVENNVAALPLLAGCSECPSRGIVHASFSTAMHDLACSPVTH